MIFGWQAGWQVDRTLYQTVCYRDESFLERGDRLAIHSGCRFYVATVECMFQKVGMLSGGMIELPTAQFVIAMRAPSDVMIDLLSSRLVSSRILRSSADSRRRRA
jgi:hypothetical protein